MIIGVNCFNISGGGTLNHLVNILKKNRNKNKIVVWAGKNALSKIPTKRNIVKKEVHILNRNLIFRIIWQIFFLPGQIRKEKIDLLFNPGGVYTGGFKNNVTMSQNILLFDDKECDRFKFKFKYLKFKILKYVQIYTFNNSKGIIFLNKYAHKCISPYLNNRKKSYAIIPHGAPKLAHSVKRNNYNINIKSSKKKLKLIYVSTIDFYKHQWNVIESVAYLQKKGYNLELYLIGSSYLPAYKKMMKAIKKVDPDKNFIKYLGLLEEKELKKHYKTADIAIFGSTCENMPNILLEYMSYSLPIVCSKKNPMPSMIKDAAIYSNFENIKSITDSLMRVISSKKLRAKIGARSKVLVKDYDWSKTADKTFNYFEDVYHAQ